MSAGAPSSTAAARDPSVTLTQDRPATRIVAQAETVRDHGAGPLREAVPDGHADEGPDDDGHDVDERPESRESGAHPRHPTGEAGPGRRRHPDPGLIPAFQHVLI